MASQTELTVNITSDIVYKNKAPQSVKEYEKANGWYASWNPDLSGVRTGGAGGTRHPDNGTRVCPCGVELEVRRAEPHRCTPQQGSAATSDLVLRPPVNCTVATSSPGPLA